jgi:ankyrin repeat protein
MSRTLSSRSSVENLKTEAKRWLRALRANDRAARTRFRRAIPFPSDQPTLRDVQFALAREYDAVGWRELVAQVEAGVPNELSRRATALRSLLEAAASGDAQRIDAVLDGHPDIISERGLLPGSSLRTALHFAVSGAHEAAVERLLERGADPNVRDEGDNALPLHFAAEKEHLPIIRLLVEHGSELTGAGDDHELEVIGWATCFGTAKPEVVGYLLAHGARHNICSAVATGAIAEIREIVRRVPAELERRMDRANQHRHPLHLAVMKQQRASLETLLELGADLETLDGAGLTALDQAALNGNADLVRVLIEHGAALRPAAAVSLGRVDVIDALLREDPDCLRPGERWGTLIVRAAERGSGAVIDALIAHGASPNVEDSPDTSVDGTYGYTPLHAAAFHGNMSAARALVSQGANLSARETRYFGTPIGWATYARHQEVVDLLLESGRVDIFDAVEHDRSDLVRAAVETDPGALERPLGDYLPVEPPDWLKASWRPVTFAKKHGKEAMVRLLLELGATEEVRSDDSPLGS